MTKREIAERLRALFPDIEFRDLEYIVDNFFGILSSALKEGAKIELRGFGVFELSRSRSYFFINPKNKQRYYLKQKVRAIFKMGKEFKERLNKPLLAGLDLGTQTFRLILGKELDGEVLFLKSFRENVRLGEGLAESGIISPFALRRAIEALRKFRTILEDYEIREYYAVGTAVFRKAKNQEEVLQKIEEETGFKIKVLSPEEEAQLTLQGVLFGLDKLGLKLQNFLMVDLGAGSTELIYFVDGKTKKEISLEIGALSLKEIFNLRYPLTKRILESIKNYVQDILKDIPFDNVESIIITGGSASLLGSLDLRLSKFEPNRLHGHRITQERLEKLINKLSGLTLPRIAKLKGMEEGREDIALPGLVIFGEILKKFGKNELIISLYGILEATLLSLRKHYN